jgi:uncharacterized Fe-S cluster-containing radical SAM superfamily protein
MPAAVAARGNFAAATAVACTNLCACYLHINQLQVQLAQQVGVPLQLEFRLLDGNGGLDAPKLCRELL